MRRVALLFGAVVLALGVGCSSAGGAGAVDVANLPAPPSYEEVVERYNARAEQLDRVWAAAVVRLRYRDDRGKLRREQGEGHFQYLAPLRLALSVGKLGETVFWLGADEQRYWWFELHDRDRAFLGRHENVGRSCNESAGLPAHPEELIELMGMTPLPDRGGRTGWSIDGRWIVAENDLRSGRIQHFLDPDTFEPVWIKVFEDGRSDASVFSHLTEYGRVQIRTKGGYDPRLATRVTIRRPGDDGEVIVDLSRMSDGRDRRGRLSPEAFDFEHLRDAFRPGRLIVLDRSCPQPAAAFAEVEAPEPESW